MVNRLYNRGRAKEYRCMEILRGEGWVVAAKDGKVLLVQVKSGKARIKSEELRELVKWAEAFNADAEVWHFKERGNLQKRRVSRTKG